MIRSGNVSLSVKTWEGITLLNCSTYSGRRIRSVCLLEKLRGGVAQTSSSSSSQYKEQRQQIWIMCAKDAHYWLHCYLKVRAPSITQYLSPIQLWNVDNLQWLPPDFIDNLHLFYYLKKKKPLSNINFALAFLFSWDKTVLFEQMFLDLYPALSSWSIFIMMPLWVDRVLHSGVFTRAYLQSMVVGCEF